VITVILNPAAGARHHDDLAPHLTELFGAAGIPVRIASFGSGGLVADAVKAAAEAGDDAVVAAGGDGTIRTVASALVGSDLPLGVLPLGTLNHFAKDLGLPLDLGEAVKTIAARRTIKVDVGEVNGRTFLNNSSIGIYPDIVVAREALRREGRWKWTAFGVATAAVLRNYRGVKVKITADSSVQVARTPFLMVGNNEYETEGLRLGARPRLNRGRLSAYLAPRLRARELPGLLALALAGRVRENHNFEWFMARELRAETPESRSVRVAVDGEVVMMTTPLNYRVRPLALRVIAPSNVAD
jgi:diacylglycerol kinase family enzyme